MPSCPVETWEHVADNMGTLEARRAVSARLSCAASPSRHRQRFSTIFLLALDVFFAVSVAVVRRVSVTLRLPRKAA